MKRIGEKELRAALANGAIIRAWAWYTATAGYRVIINGTGAGYIVSDLFSKLLHDGTIVKSKQEYSYADYTAAATKEEGEAPAAEQEQEPAPETEPEQQPEQEPVYLDEHAPSSNSIPNVYYQLTVDTQRCSYTKHLYTVDDLQTTVRQIKQAGETITEAVRINTETGEQIPFVPETRQEQTDRENRDYCRRIAEKIEAYAAGNIYRCPECGETFELYDPYGENHYFDENENEIGKCPNCGYISENENNFEQLSLYDYFEDVLDIEYRVDSDRKTIRSVSLMVTCGGPNIYIDTAEKAVLLYWWTDKARYYLSSDVCDQINEWGEELWNC